MVQIIIGKPGSGKTTLIFNKIMSTYEKNSAILLVPDQFSFECERSLLRLCGATNSDKYEVLSFSRLANTVFRQYGGVSAQIISETGRIGRMFLAINQVKNELNFYKKQSNNIDFVAKMLELVTEFKRNDINLDDIQFINTNEHRLKLKITDILLILKAYDALADNENVDPEDELDMLYSHLINNNFFDGKNVFIDSFNDFTAKQLKIIEQLIKNAKNTYISFTEQSIAVKEDSAFTLTNNSIKSVMYIAQKNNVQLLSPIILDDIYRYKNEELKFISNNMHLYNNTIIYDKDAYNIKLTACKNIYEEVDYLAKSINNLTRESGYKYSEISVVAYNIAEYKSIIKHVFSRYNIPFFIDEYDTFDSTFLYSIVKNLIDICLYGFKTDKIMYILKSLKLFYNSELQYEFEDFINYWNIDMDLWLNTFEDVFYKKNISENKLSEFEGIRKNLVYIIEKFCIQFNSVKIDDKCNAIFSALKAFDTIEILKKRAEEYILQNNLTESSLLVTQYQTLIKILTQLSISLNKLECDNMLFQNIFKTCSISTKIEVTPNRPDEVKIGNARLIRPSDPKAIFILGCNDGIYPNDFGSSDLLSLYERKQLMQNGLNISDKLQHKNLIDNYIVYSTFCFASELLFVSYNNYDTAQNELNPSYAVKNLLNNFSKLFVTDYFNENIYSKYDLFEKIALNYNKNNPLFQTYKKILEDIDEIIFIEKLESAQLNTKIIISKENVNKINLFDKVISPTQLENYFKCQFSYFCKYILNLHKPEKAVFMSSDKGKIIHFVLEQFFKNFIGQEEIIITDEEIKNLVNIYFEEFVEAEIEVFDKNSRRSIYKFEKYKNLTINFIKFLIEEINKSEFVIKYCELKLIDNKNNYLIELPNGKKIKFKGVIDRVDILEHENKCYIKIIDYKTGSKEFDINDTLEGQNLQMLLYLFVMLNNKELVLNGKKTLPAGVLYAPVIAEKGKTYFKKRSGLILDEDIIMDNLKLDKEHDYSPKKDSEISSVEFINLQKIIYGKIEEMFERIENGYFEINPLDSEDSACVFCDYSSLCKNEHKLLNRKIKKRSKEEIKKILSDGNEV